VPVVSAAGELHGALAIVGQPPGDEAHQRLLVHFARQLGKSLDILHLTRQLAATQGHGLLGRAAEGGGSGLAITICPRCRRCYEGDRRNCPADGSRLELRAFPSRLVGRYRLSQLLGEGGMGVVFAATDEKLRREVAIKLIRPDRFQEPNLRQRFEREARAVARIQHPGVVAVHDWGDLEDGTTFLVMEKLEGRDLSTQMALYGKGSYGRSGNSCAKGLPLSAPRTAPASCIVT
jgi:hypothetical protein